MQMEGVALQAQRFFLRLADCFLVTTSASVYFLPFGVRAPGLFAGATVTIIQSPLATAWVEPSRSPEGGGDDHANEGDVVLELRNITKAYARKDSSALPAVSNINLKVRRGEVLCLMGTSGSGKSTLLRHINPL